MIKLLVLLQKAPMVHEGAKKIVELDPIGIGMTVIAMSVVFLSLLVFYIVFKNIAKVYSIDLKKRFNKKKGIVEEKVVTEDPTSELGAAVALALYFYQNELHDYENTLLTIAKVGKTYSPWSSKIYGLRKSPK